MKERVKAHATYQKLAANYSAMIDYKPHNALYDRPNTLSLLPEVKGKKILDAGCGPGKYAEVLLSQGAEIVGIDLSENMIAEAKKRNPNKGHFFVHDLMQPLDFLEDESIDIVICPLVLDYIQDWNPVFKEFYRVLKPGGIFVFSVTHPFFDYEYYKSENYFITEKVSCTWTGFGEPVEVQSFRRSLMDCINVIMENGLRLDKILEPKPIPEFQKYDPKHYEELMQFPAFICIRAIKPD